MAEALLVQAVPPCLQLNDVELAHEHLAPNVWRARRRKNQAQVLLSEARNSILPRLAVMC